MYLPFTHAALMKNSHTAEPDSAGDHYYNLINNMKEGTRSGQLPPFWYQRQPAHYRDMLTATSAR